jgi:hypothetical protein
MIQDRNIHRDAQLLRKAITVPLIAPAFGVDQDEPIYASIPRYNWRLEGLSVYASSIAVAELIVKVQAVPRNAVVGSPQLGQSPQATFTIEEYWKTEQGGDGLFNNPPVPAQAFGPRGVATVLDGFWGVWLIQVNQSNDRDVIRAAPVMSFPTEAEALRHCPRPRATAGGGTDTQGRLAILTVHAVGGDFIAGTTLTNNGAIVAAFNTAPQDGHVAQLNISTNPNQVQATLQQRTQDASGTNIIQGKGLPIPGAAMIVLSVRKAGLTVVTGGQAILEYRPWPAGGEGRGDSTRTKNRPSFVP